jgi:hypothetical protein
MYIYWHYYYEFVFDQSIRIIGSVNTLVVGLKVVYMTLSPLKDCLQNMLSFVFVDNIHERHELYHVEMVC